MTHYDAFHVAVFMIAVVGVLVAFSWAEDKL